ncbi:hypothetical protein [Streptomyces coelicoflavus]|uniref:hypothetical protein n=1 Tax=Streptomyces coelicoflavus TaxID=285562 RepID=UPI001EF37B98|nr:hypothetical protein [Streptomyces coelicoflavus]
MPRDIPMGFDDEAMPDIDHWVRGRGDRLLFVNGGQDPSVAEPFRPGARDSRVLWVPNANHHVTVGDLPDADRSDAVAMIRRRAGGGRRRAER